MNDIKGSDVYLDVTKVKSHQQRSTKEFLRDIWVSWQGFRIDLFNEEPSKSHFVRPFCSVEVLHTEV